MLLVLKEKDHIQYAEAFFIYLKANVKKQTNRKAFMIYEAI